MANARPELKQAADHICPAHTEDGVARYLAEHVLGGKL
jgi:hydroxymethylpyrimidine pyrophosphatase-like HAD family hydrolase